MLLEAPRNLDGSGGSAWDLAVADGGRLPLRDACVDLCLCVNVVAHAPNYRGILSEVGRVLKPGGTFVLNYFNAFSVLFPLALIVNCRNRGLRRDVFTQWLAPRTVGSVCAKAGLSISGRRGQTHVPVTVPRPVSLVQGFVDPAFRRSPLSAIAPHHIIAARRFVAHLIPTATNNGPGEPSDR
jgi:SAM-dependent methyltransferase